MESPYRNNDAPTICTSGRPDQRCSPTTALSPVARGVLFIAALSLAVYGAVAVVATGAARVALLKSRVGDALPTIELASPVGCALPGQSTPSSVPAAYPYPSPPPDTLATTQAEAPAVSLPWPPSLIAAMLPESHDPIVLLQRSRALIAAGHDLTLSQVTVPGAAVVKEGAELGSFRARVVPVAARDRVGGVQLLWVPPDSLLERLGLEQGDVVTSVNGFPPTEPQWLDALSVTQARVLVEVVRGKHRIALYVSWKR